jgi:hypothetical protein
MEKKYQVFVSSTYQDLIDERSKVVQTLLANDCIPCGMELFPAADEDQFEYIKKMIDLCDYYIVIIAGQYGSVSTKGISYTEMEYDYAATLRSHGKIEVLSFIHGSLGKLPGEKLESDPVKRKKLEDFITKAKANKLVRFWKNIDELSSEVGTTLRKVMIDKPKNGWVRDFPYFSKHSQFYESIKSSLKDLQQLVVHANATDNKYKLLIYDWIIKNKYAKFRIGSDETIKINILRPGEKARQLFGGIITQLEEGDVYHTLSNLTFWVNDLVANERGFIDDNIDAINKKVIIERVILVDSDILDNPSRNKARLIQLDNLVKEFIQIILEDGRLFTQIKTQFVFLSTTELAKLPDVPMATILSGVNLKHGRLDDQSITSESHVMQITSIKSFEQNLPQVDAIDISFLDKTTMNKIFRLESKFLELQKHPTAMNISELHEYLNKLDATVKFRPLPKTSIRDQYVLFTDNYSIIEIQNQNNVENLFPQAILKLRSKEDGSWTVVDKTDNILECKSKDLIIFKDETNLEKTSREDHNWRMIKIERPDSLKLTGVISSISKGFHRRGIPVCLFCVFDGVLVFVKDVNYKETLEFMRESYDLRYFEGLHIS